MKYDMGDVVVKVEVAKVLLDKADEALQDILNERDGGAATEVKCLLLALKDNLDAMEAIATGKAT